MQIIWSRENQQIENLKNNHIMPALLFWQNMVKENYNYVIEEIDWKCYNDQNDNFLIE